MNCPFCGIANPDHGTFCVQCGKQLKRTKPVLIPSSSMPGSSIAEQTTSVEDEMKRTNSNDGDKHTDITPPRRDDIDDLQGETAPSIAAVSLPSSTSAEDPERSTDSSSSMLPAFEEMPTQSAPNPAIEAEITQVGTPPLPEEQTMVEHQQEPSLYPGHVEYSNYPNPSSSPDYPPAYGGTLSSPYYPSYPASDGMYQSAPGYQQGQPGISGTQYPPMNGYPPQPGSFANQTGEPPTAGYPYPPIALQQPVEREKIAPIARPLPRWILILCIVAILVILALLQATGSDWADGAIHAAIGAVIIAVLLLVFAGIRTALGMANTANSKRRTQYIGSALAIMLLFVYSGLNLIGQTPLHTFQAHYVEGQRHWQQAINEYQLSGETAPTSVNLARTYDEWGEELNGSGLYTNALSKFEITLNNYTASNEITRAQKGEINSYFSLGKQAAQSNNYTSATKEFDTALGLPFCHEECQKQVNPSDATAYYNLAQSQLKTQQYNDAVNNFKTVQSRFVNSPEAKNIHRSLATALLGKGKQDKANVCTSAIPTYQDLATNYADTPEGKEATTAMSQPQSVTGHFTAPLPTDTVPMAVLTTTPIDGNMSDNQFTSTIDSSPSVLIKSDGTFTFQSEKQGTYDLAWVNIGSDGSIYYTFYFAKNDPAKPAYYVAKVGPLCSFDFGDIPEPVIHA